MVRPDAPLGPARAAAGRSPACFPPATSSPPSPHLFRRGSLRPALGAPALAPATTCLRRADRAHAPLAAPSPSRTSPRRALRRASGRTGTSRAAASSSGPTRSSASSRRARRPPPRAAPQPRPGRCAAAARNALRRSPAAAADADDPRTRPSAPSVQPGQQQLPPGEGGGGHRHEPQVALRQQLRFRQVQDPRGAVARQLPPGRPRAGAEPFAHGPPRRLSSPSSTRLQHSSGSAAPRPRRVLTAEPLVSPSRTARAAL